MLNCSFINLKGSDAKANRDSIAQFSKKDAKIYDQYNNEMEKLGKNKMENY